MKREMMLLPIFSMTLPSRIFERGSLMTEARRMTISISGSE